MISLILGFLGTLLPGLASTIGDVIIKNRQTAAARQGKEDDAAKEIVGASLLAITEANKARVEARKNEGAWGPMGIITFIVGLALAYHVWLIVLDSSPFHPTIVFKFYIVPWIGFAKHEVGSWGVSTLGKLHEVELAILQALFYVGPPSAAAIVAAKMFRR